MVLTLHLATVSSVGVATVCPYVQPLHALTHMCKLKTHYRTFCNVSVIYIVCAFL